MSESSAPWQVVVASANPVKLTAVHTGFERMFPDATLEIIPCDAASGVRDQPMTDDETRQGALNRVAAIRAEHPSADYWVGIEGGIQRIGDRYAAFAWIVVAARDATGESRSGTFPLPPGVAALIDEGMELGHANDLVFGEHNSKQNAGAVGLLTGGVIDRTELYVHAMQLALIPLKQTTLYSGHE